MQKEYRNMTPKISVITGIFKSVLRQTYANIEYIVIESINKKSLVSCYNTFIPNREGVREIFSLRRCKYA